MSGISSAVNIIEQCASRLAEAEATRRPGRPPTELFPQLSLSDAYRIQLANIARRTRSGERIIGHKVGLTARTMQELFSVNEPDYGHLLNTMVHDENAPLDLSELIDPQIEVEPAFVLKRTLAGTELTIGDVLEATDYVSVCFEVIDSRIEDWKIRIQDTVADNGSSARVVLGSKRVRPSDLRLDDLETVLELDGEIVERGNTGAILDHPAHSVAWLAKTIAQFGVTLGAGDIVLPGTCTRSRRIGGHRSVTGRIEGLGQVTLQLANSPFVTKPA